MATYIRLTDYKDSESKEEGFFKSENRYEAKQDDFEKIPGSPIAYWVSDRVKEIFEKSERLENISEFKTGMSTGDNEIFQRYWNEVELLNINFKIRDSRETINSLQKWFPCKSGGEYRKWYGNNEIIVNWQNDGYEIKNFYDENGKQKSRPQNSQFFFRKSLTWSKITSYKLSLRFNDYGFAFDGVGLSAFLNDENIKYMQSFLNSNLSYYFTSILNQSMHIVIGDMNKLPIIFTKDNYIKEKIDTLTQECIDISKEEWDSRETSWDFQTNELIRIFGTKVLTLAGETEVSLLSLENVYNSYCEYWKEKFYKLHSNEEELNRLFIDIYELQDELTPDVELKDITILKAESFINDSGELEFKADEIIKQLISYAVGCMFGRYSLDKSGLCIANLGSDELISQMIDETKVSFPIDDDNVIPVLEDDYFSDDIASRIVNFVKVVFGEQNLSENINFIEKSLGKTIRAYMVKDFYEDHIKRYKKRPIYWMVSSPKKEFMSLSYMHRYKSDLFALVQNSYLREYITKLEATKEVLHSITIDENSSVKDKKDADKRIKAIETKLKEIISFDRNVLTSYAQNKIEIDLDDGVKVNYSKFKDVLYTIKGLV